MAKTGWSRKLDMLFPSNRRNFVILLLLAVSLLPLWTNSYPPLQDYADWLLQAQIVRRFRDPDFGFGEHYVILDSLVPSAGGVLLIYSLSFAVPIEVAGKVALSMAVLGLPLALLCFVRSVQGRPSAADFFCLFLGYNFFFFMGYLSYVLGLAALFLALACVWRRLDSLSSFGFVPFLASAAVLLLVLHPVPWGVFGFVLATWLFLSPGRAKGRTAAVVFLSFAPSILLFVNHLSSGHSTLGWFPYPSLRTKLVSYVEPFIIYPAWYPWSTPVPPLAPNVIFWLAIGAVLLTGFKRMRGPDRAGRAEPTLLAAGLGLLLITLPAPAWAFDLLRPDERLVIPVVLLAFSGVAWPRPKLACDAMLSLLFLAVFFLNFLTIGHGSRQLALLVEDLSPFVTKNNHPFFLPVPCNSRELSAARFLPAVDGASRAGFYWTIARGGNNRQIFETRMLRVREKLPVSILAVTEDGMAETVERFQQQFLLQYRHVALIGCPPAIRRAAVLLASEFEPLATGTFRSSYLLILTRRVS